MARRYCILIFRVNTVCWLSLSMLGKILADNIFFFFFFFQENRL